MIKDNLKHAGFDEALLGESKAWKGEIFNLKKDQSVLVPESLTHIRIGLGWDTRVDIDASIICFDKDGNEVDLIYYGKTRNHNKSILHQGDNLTGEGEGDDEVIDIELSNLPDNIDSFWPVITIYSSGKSFKNVSGAFCRVLDKTTKKEFCHFNLSNNRDGVSNGNIMGVFRKVGDNKWAFTAKGLYTKGSSSPSNITKFIK